MSQTFNIPNFSDLNTIEKAGLNADAAASQAVITLKSAQNIAADHYVLIGGRGTEGGELHQVLSVSGLAVTLTTNLVRAHDRFEEVVALFGNKIRVYRADNVNGTAPAAASFSALNTIAIDYDQTDTPFTDADGGDGYWYGFTYLNEETGDETDLNDCIFMRGTGSNNTNYASIESIRKKAGLMNNRWITDATIEEKRQAAQKLIDSTLVGIYTVPFTAPINPLISEITRLLAAGWLLTDDYGPLNSLDTREGQNMLNQVMNKDKTGYLDRLDARSLDLTDQSGTSTAIPGSGNGISLWPNTTTATTDPIYGGGDRMFRTGGWQGYNERKY